MPARSRACALCVALLLATDQPTLAQSIAANRPGFAFSPAVVPEGRLQLETGMAYDRSSRLRNLPQMELRLGSGASSELFISSITWFDGGRSTEVDGWGDVTVGAKFALPSRKTSTQTALLLQVTAPVGDDELSSDSWNPSAAYIWSVSELTPGGLALAGTAQISRFDDDVQLDNSVQLVLPLGSRRGAFVEWEVNLPEAGGARHWLNTAYQWFPSQRVQIDINAGLGLNKAAGSYRVGLGLSRLF